MQFENGDSIRLSYLGGQEKTHVREQCWIPLLKKRKAQIDRRLKYLTLPGRQLTEIRRLVEEKIIEGPEDLILVEQDLLDYYTILREAPLLHYLYNIEPLIAINGDINNLIVDGKLSDER